MSAEEQHPMEGAVPNLDTDLPSRDVPELDSLKRKASRDDDDEGSPKRSRRDDNRRSRQESPPPRRGSFGNDRDSEHDRRKSATQEEKKRGKRLFGGLLSTLSQTSGNSTQKRRREIEQRQQERIAKQKVEDDRQRAEKRMRLTEVRMSQQMAWEEEVMRHKHTKMLAMAKFLRTKSHPWIYYRPWKLTPGQEDEIESQVKDAKATIERDIEAFKERKKWYNRDNGRPPTAQSATSEKPSAFVGDASVDKAAKGTDGSELPTKGPDKEHHNRHHHDESADVMEVVDEDMLIY